MTFKKRQTPSTKDEFEFPLTDHEKMLEKRRIADRARRAARKAVLRANTVNNEDKLTPNGLPYFKQSELPSDCLSGAEIIRAKRENERWQCVGQTTVRGGRYYYVYRSYKGE